MTDHVLKVEDLSVSFPQSGGRARILHNVDFALERGTVLGIVGASASCSGPTNRGRTFVVY